MPERQCVGCKRQAEWGCEAEKYPTTSNDPQATQDTKGNWWRWNKPSLLPMTVDGEESWACPRQDLKRRGPEWHRMLLYYGMYRKGHLPQPGAVMDQANKAIELFRVFDDVNAECDEALLDRVKAGRERDRKAAETPSRGRRGNG